MYHPHKIPHIFPAVGHDHILNTFERFAGIAALAAECASKYMTVFAEEVLRRFERIDVTLEGLSVFAFETDENDKIAILEPDTAVLNDVHNKALVI